MPRRTDIRSILIIGAGPIVIGQACEFDYSGTQACEALRAGTPDVLSTQEYLAGRWPHRPPQTRQVQSEP